MTVAEADMTQQDGLAVVIPAYNSALTIEGTIRSVLAQTTPAQEIVVVDDGSSDDTRGVVEKFEEQVRYVRTDNFGPGHARHRGVLETSSSWIAFLDSDDQWHPSFITSQLEARTADPSARMIFCDSRMIREDRTLYSSKFALAPDGYWGDDWQSNDKRHVIHAPLYPLLLTYQPVLVGTYILHRTLYQEAGGFPSPLSRKPSEDFEFILRCAQFSPVIANREILLSYMARPTSFSGTGEGFVAGDIRILEYATTHHPAGHENLHLIKEQIIRRSADVVHHAYERRDRAMLDDFIMRIPFRRRGLRMHIKWLVARTFPKGRPASRQ